MNQIFADNLRFVDDKGRTRLLNGMNIADKHIDSERFHYVLDEEFFTKYRANGFDIIRLGITWQNLEPTMGEYNETYLRSIDEIFRLAEKYGVYILLDMHQDIYSGNGGKSAGDGAPEWAVISDGAKPRMPIFVWADGYFFGKWVHRSFNHFWNNTPVDGIGLQDRYCKLWQMLAKRYGDSPALFGFDLMNEPFPGSEAKRMFIRVITGTARVILFNKNINRGKLFKAAVKRDSKSVLECIGGNVIRDVVKKVDVLSEKFDLKKYSPFLNKTSAAIRDITGNGIFMMEQSYLCNSGVKQFVPPITVNGEREKNQCYGPHAYDFTVDTPLYQYANSSRVKAFFTEMRNTQLRLQVPVIVGEWGGCSDNTDTSWFPHAYELLDFFDEKQWGHMYWCYQGNDMDAPLMNMLSRTHPVAIDGEIKNYGYDREQKLFTITFDSAAKSESFIYIHKAFKLEKDNDIKYRTAEKYENGASLIAITADKGEKTVKIKITE